MMESISVDRVLDKLDTYLHKNDYAGAERHLLFWLGEGLASDNPRLIIAIRNELMGLYRKLGRREEALACVKMALEELEARGVSQQSGAATTLLNAATVYKAFGMAEEALPLFLRAREIYERELAADDARLAGLYNNMALALVDLSRFEEAISLYGRAIAILEARGDSAPEIAITHLNIASAKESAHGLLKADAEISEQLSLARTLLDGCDKRDGHYAFVCEKCASVFGYYGHFAYEAELAERARRIYEGS